MQSKTILSSALRLETLTVASVVIGSAVLGSWGIGWGLPSKERNLLCFRDGRNISPGVQIPKDLVHDSARWFPEFRREKEVSREYPRSFFNPIRSYHPDEYVIFKGLSNTNPLRLDFATGIYAWPGFMFYSVGAGLGVGHVFRVVHLTRDLTYYFSHPEKMAGLYLVGRWITLTFSLAAIVAIYVAGLWMFGHATGLLAAALVAASPLFVCYQHYMTGDLAMAFFAALFLLFAAKALRSGDMATYLWAGLWLGLGASTKYRMAILAPLLPVVHYLRLREKQGAARALSDVFSIPMFAAAGVAIGVFALLNPTLVFHPSELYRVLAGEASCVSTAAGQWVNELGDTLFRPLELLASGFGFPAVVAMAAGACLAVTGRRRRDLLLLWGAGIVYVMMALIGTMYPRHLFPALPMLALLASRVVFQMRDSLRGKTARWVAVVAAGIVLLVPQLYRSVGYARLFAADNVRTEAGRWIARNVPENASIGTPHEPWQFDFPPADKEHNPVQVTGFETHALTSQRAPDFYILSDRQRDPMFVRPTPQVQSFWRELKRGGTYAFHREFLRSPRVWDRLDTFVRRHSNPFWRIVGLDLNSRDVPEDMRYVNPVITVYRRADVPLPAPRQTGT